MAGLGIRLYTDEMIDYRLAVQLRRLGYDALACQEAGRGQQGISDEDQLAFAAREGRAILTFNQGDFTRLELVWKSANRRHAGIILSPGVDDVGDLLRRTRSHLDLIPPEVQHNTLLWLAAPPRG